MKILLFSFVLIFNITCANATDLINIVQRDTIIGKNKLTQKPITANEIIFPGNIYKSYLNANSDFVSLQLRDYKKTGRYFQDQGVFLVYDLKNNKEKWSRKINYNSFKILQTPGSLVFTSKDISYVFDVNNGSLQTRISNQLSYVDNLKKIGLGYISGAFNETSTKLLAYDLSNGKKIWKTHLSKKYGWNTVFHLKDTSLIIISSGVHKFNLRNGKGWDLRLLTGFYEYSQDYIYNTLGLMSGILTGVFFFSIQQDIVTHTQSNTIVTDENIYIAAADEIVKLNYDGKIEWSNTFSRDTTGLSVIFIRDSTLYLLNSGYAYVNGQRIHYGQPYFAAFETSSGKELFNSTITHEKTHILDFTTVKDTLYLILSNHSIVKASMKTGSIIFNHQIDLELGGQIIKFADEKYGYTKNNNFISPILTDTINLYCFSTLGSIQVLNTKLNNISTINDNEVGKIIFQDIDYMFIKNNQKIKVADNSGTIVAELNFEKILTEENGFLYGIQDNRIFEIKLSDLK